MFKATLFVLVICFFVDAIGFDSYYRHHLYNEAARLGHSVGSLQWSGVLT
jgi:hypothetical protein